MPTLPGSRGSRARTSLVSVSWSADQSARSTLATASAAIPSPRPTNPMPSFVVNLTFTSIALMPMQRASERAHLVPVRSQLRRLADQRAVHVAHRPAVILEKRAHVARGAACWPRPSTCRRRPGSAGRCRPARPPPAARRSSRASGRRRPSGRSGPCPHPRSPRRQAPAGGRPRAGASRSRSPARSLIRSPRAGGRGRRTRRAP